VERAQRHRTSAHPGVPIWTILEHLDVPRRGSAARRVRRRLDALQGDGLLERTRRHSVLTWALTRAGRERLEETACAGELPESPQHRAWRNARTLAAQELERFRGQLQGQLQDAELLLVTDPPPRSDAWLALAETLRHGCRRLASAYYCLQEWAEPDEAVADVDDGSGPDDAQLEPGELARRRALRSGRRNPALWREHR
jgi:hypothetical protein